MSIRGSLIAGLLALTLAGCEDKKATRPEGADSGAPRPASHGDKNILDAVEAAGSAAAQQGPPENGVFAPGAADKELRLGDPPKVVVGSKGTAPLVQFVTLGVKPAKKLEGKVEVAIQTGPRSAMPTIELGLTTEPPEKPADPAALPGPVEVVVKASAAKLAADQPGQLPPGADKMIGKARGSRMRFEMLPNGAAHVKSVEPSKDLDDSLALVVRAASDAVAFAFQPYPTEPVGAGGFWLVTSREPYGGLDAVVYRMFKVVEVKPESVILDVNVKRFVNRGQLALPGLPPHHVEEFSDNTSGRIEVLPSDTSQVHAQLTDMMGAGLSPEGAAAQAQAQGQRMQMQIQIKTRLTLGR